MPRIPAIGVRGPVDRAGRRDRSRQEWRGRQVAADLLQHQRRFGRAESKPALAFGNADAGQAKLGELLPQAVAEAVLAADLAPVAKLPGDARLPRRGSSPQSPAAFSGRR